MSDLRIKRQVSQVARVTDDEQWMNARGTRDGAIITADWMTAMAMQGRCFGVNTGTDTQPTTFNATWAAAEPDLYITAPKGTTIIPVMIQINFEDLGTGEVLDVYAIASSTSDTSLSGTALTPSIYNMRMDKPFKSLCTATGVVTSGTDPASGNYVEFWRGNAGIPEDSFADNDTPTSELVTRTSWVLKDSQAPPVIVGTGSLSIYASAQAGKGFITAIWVEVPSSSIQ